MRYLKRYMQRFWRRSVAFLLCCFSLALAVFFTQAARYAWNRDWYTGGSMDFVDTDACEEYVWDCTAYVADYLKWQGTISEEVVSGYSGSAYACVIWNTATGQPILSTVTTESVMVDVEISGTYTHVQSVVSASEAAASGETAAENVLVEGTSVPFVVQGFINLPIEPYSGCYAEYRVHELMTALAPWAIPMAVFCYLLAAALATALMLWTLRWQPMEKLSLFGRAPMDVLSVALLLLALLLVSFCRDELYATVIGMSYSRTVLDALVVVLGLPACRAFIWMAAALSLAMAISEQARRHLLAEKLFMGRVPVFGRIGICLVLMLLLAGVQIFTGYLNEPLLLAQLGLALVCLALVGAAARQNERLRRAAERLAAGELDHKVDTRRLPPGLREQGECLNRIGQGMQAAVDEQLRGERFKTELITNVSHDLKTPITSIVSYVDLLKKEDVSPAQAKEYIEVIDRQSGKLKKLTEDLVEASKASAGAIKVQREPVDVAELLSQSVGEYTQRLEAAQVEPVLNLPEEECLWDTDGRLLWRVLENLTQNMVKYAQPGTRAYFDLKKSEKGLSIELKNTSAQPLNIPAEELLARFVRGDGARHSEGSGLGLSIAQSLTELLGGTMTLYLDGDLFKVSLRFEEAE